MENMDTQRVPNPEPPMLEAPKAEVIKKTSSFSRWLVFLAIVVGIVAAVYAVMRNEEAQAPTVVSHPVATSTAMNNTTLTSTVQSLPPSKPFATTPSSNIITGKTHYADPVYGFAFDYPAGFILNIDRPRNNNSNSAYPFITIEVSPGFPSYQGIDIAVDDKPFTKTGNVLSYTETRIGKNNVLALVAHSVQDGVNYDDYAVSLGGNLRLDVVVNRGGSSALAQGITNDMVTQILNSITGARDYTG